MIDALGHFLFQPRGETSFAGLFGILWFGKYWGRTMDWLGDRSYGVVAVKKYICRHCHCEVVSKTNTRPKLGQEHSKKCPRRNSQ